MKELAFLIVGWVLGIAQSLIIEQWQAREKRKRFVSALEIELCRLQSTMALMHWDLKDRNGSGTRTDIHWVLSRTARAATNDDAGTGSFRGNLEHMLQFSDEQIATVMKHSAQKRQGSGFAVSLRTYDLPLLEAQLPELAGLKDVKAVVEVLGVRGQLSIYNETVMEAREFLDKTFDESVTGTNRQKVLTIIEDRYERIIDRSKWMADAIERCLVALKGH